LVPDTIEFWKGRESRLHDRIFYSKKYYDEKYEYRHCELRHEGLSTLVMRHDRNRSSPDQTLEEEFIPLVQILRGITLSETQWRGLGITMSMGWRHYLAYKPNPTVLCFRRPKGCDGRTGMAPEDWTPYEGEFNFWEIESFEPGDEVWIRDQLSEPVITECSFELEEGTRLEVLKVTDDRTCVKKEVWAEAKWIPEHLKYAITHHNPANPRAPPSVKKSEKPKPKLGRGRKRKKEEASDRNFGTDLEQSKRTLLSDDNPGPPDLLAN